MSTTWMVRAGEGGYLIDDFKSHSVVAIGWAELGDLSTISSKDELRQRIDRTYPEAVDRSRAVSANTVWKFLKEFKAGDIVMSYNPTTRMYLVGEISGPCRYDAALLEDYTNIRPVKWTGSVSRDDLSINARNSLGAIQTLFTVPSDVWEEIQGLLKGEKPARLEKDADAELQTIKLDIGDRAREFIKDLVQGLTPEEMQDFVAGLLRGMGYRTSVSAKGPDRGKDIVASPDGLGLEQPRIRVEVKHRPRQRMGAPEIRSFIGALRSSDKGLYVSTGGFSNEAQYEAERSNVPVTLADLDTLVDLLEQHYERLDAETRTLVPLTRVYWPADIK